MKIPTLLKLAALLGVAPKSQDPSIEMPAKGSRPSRGPAWYRAQKGIPDPWGGHAGPDHVTRQRHRSALRRGRFREAQAPFKIVDVDGPRTVRLPRRVRRAIARDLTRSVREMQSAAVCAGLG